jgi:hypothetical protein
MSAAYGVAIFIHAFGFVAVFAAGVALRHEELRATGDKPPFEVLENMERGEKSDVAKDPERAHAYLAEAMMGFTLEMERIAELSSRCRCFYTVRPRASRSSAICGIDNGLSRRPAVTRIRGFALAGAPTIGRKSRSLQKRQGL